MSVSRTEASGSGLSLWPVACAICVMVAASALIGIQPAETILRPKAIKALFFVLGFAFPVIAWVASDARVPGRVRYTITAIGVFLIGCYIIQARRFGVAPFAALELVVAWPLLRVAWQQAEDRTWSAWATAITVFGGWSLAATISYSVSIADLLLGRSEFGTGAAPALAFTIATIAGTWTLTNRSAAAQSRLSRLVDLLALAGFAVASLRRDVPFLSDDHHVSFFIGPVEAVRQGHWLLWDIPSQYGVGNLWLVGHLPAPSSYSAFTYANALLIFCGAAITYAIARTWAKAPIAAAFCAATVIASTYFIGGVWFVGIGAEHYPSVGAMRFIWCYVLVGLVTFAYYRGLFAAHAAQVLTLGSVCWLAAIWWSAESAIFATVIWLPAAIAIMWLSAVSLRQSLRNIVIAATAALATIVIVEVVFFVHFGHGPDWQSFFEFGLLYQGGSQSTPLTTLGGAWLLVCVFASLVTLILLQLRAKSYDGLPVLVAAAAAQWATMSYFVVRSHDNNVDNLVPIQLLVLFAAMTVVTRENISIAVSTGFRLFTVPIAAMCCALAFRLWPFTPQAGYFVADPGNWSAVARPIPPQERALLERHGLGPSSPILYLGPSVSLMSAPQWPGSNATPQVWTPGVPILLISQLPATREETYVQRFAASAHLSGYTVADSSGPPLAVDFLNALDRVYSATVLDHEGQYVLTRYDQRP